MSDQTNTAWWALRIAFFIGLVLSGLDKFFHLLANWDQYLSPTAQRMMGSHSHQFTLVAGAVEVILGLLVITGWTKLGAYLASAWLLLMAINLVMTGQYGDIALRDRGLCLGAFALAKLTSAGEAEMLHVVPTEIPRAA
jgi:uncharacterized membrane protein YphA (DoxX/SURF4 family)